MTPLVDEVRAPTKEFAETVLREGQQVFDLESNYPEFCVGTKR